MQPPIRREPRNQAEQWLLDYIDNILKLSEGHNMVGTDVYQKLRDEGSFFEPVAPLPEGFRKLPRGMCFQNAAHLAHDNPNTLSYVEGFAHSIIPIHHAWVTNEAGIAIDPTWNARKTKESRGKAYYGVIVPTQTMRDRLVERRLYGNLIL